MEFLRRPHTMAAEELDDLEDLLALAWWCEPSMQLTRRTAALDRLEALTLHVEPDGLHDWQAELGAERAVDAARRNDVEAARRRSTAVLSSSTSSALARARATEALGRALAWTGTDASSREADRVLSQAFAMYIAMGAFEWAGFVTFWRGNAVHLQNGDLDGAEELMLRALEHLGSNSPWRATVLSYYGDLLISRGRWNEADEAFDEAAGLAEADGDVKTQSYVAWSRARLSSVGLDAAATERHLREVERDHGDWFQMNTGATFLADAAELMARVGLTTQADNYLQRAKAVDSGDEFVRQAEATLMARSGNPELALDQLQDLVRGNWIEKRLQWRHTLLAAWATLRLARDGAGPLAARSFAQAAEVGGIEVAVFTEPDLTQALLPLAAHAGSAAAYSQMLRGRAWAVHLFGRFRVTDRVGAELTVAPGQPAELVRFLAVHPDGVLVEQVLDIFFPDVSPSVARNRLRQVLARLRTSTPELVVREGPVLTLAPAWVDVQEFLGAARRVRTSRGARAVQHAYGALALWTGPPLSHDPYSDWASDLRTQLEHFHLTLSELVATDAAHRGSHEEALTALESMRPQLGGDGSRTQAMVRHLRALGRHSAADHLANTDHHDPPI